LSRIWLGDCPFVFRIEGEEEDDEEEEDDGLENDQSDSSKMSLTEDIPRLLKILIKRKSVRVG
jgi:hypothetical protein